jgi:DNA-binding phage protein
MRKMGTKIGNTVVYHDEIIEMINNYHLAIAATGKHDSHSRMLYASKHMAKKTGKSSTVLYKALDRALAPEILDIPSNF